MAKLQSKKKTITITFSAYPKSKIEIYANPSSIDTTGILSKPEFKDLMKNEKIIKVIFWDRSEIKTDEDVLKALSENWETALFLRFSQYITFASIVSWNLDPDSDPVELTFENFLEYCDWDEINEIKQAQEEYKKKLTSASNTEAGAWEIKTRDEKSQ